MKFVGRGVTPTPTRACNVSPYERERGVSFGPGLCRFPINRVRNVPNRVWNVTTDSKSQMDFRLGGQPRSPEARVRNVSPYERGRGVSVGPGICSFPINRVLNVPGRV